MARYIDADKFLEQLEKKKSEVAKVRYTDGFNDAIMRVKSMVSSSPTADVVPRSEVERLVDKWIGEENLTKDEKTLRLIEALQDEARRYERYYFNHEYDKLIAEAKSEVAREIFEEIEKNMVIFGDASLSTYFRGIGWKVFAELKKKYMED